MADHIPFLTSEDGSELIKKVFQDSQVVRVPVDRAAKLVPSIDSGCKVWLDPCVDGIDDVEGRRFINKWQPDGSAKQAPNPWFTFMSKCQSFEKVATSLESPNKSDVIAFVHAILDHCASFKPAWITIPQAPLVTTSARNKVNRLMATAAGLWKSKSSFSGHLIFPLIVTNQNQINGKTARNPRVKQAEKSYLEAQCSGFWVVDKSLSDDSGVGTLANTRFPGIIGLHEELNSQVATQIKVGGPYWGLNLLLWARGLVDYPAIGIGSSYQYFLAGSRGKSGDVRIPLSSLRRRVVLGPQLKAWLTDAASKLDASHPAHTEFVDLVKNFAFLESRAREAIATFYKQWFEKIAVAPKTGRSMVLFQDLAAAYALGKTLPDIPNEKVRRPEAVAEPLMLNCLQGG
jgi:hypothetical protein